MWSSTDYSKSSFWTSTCNSTICYEQKIETLKKICNCREKECSDHWRVETVEEWEPHVHCNTLLLTICMWWMLPGDCQSMPITICSYCVKWQLVSQIDNGSVSSVAILGSEAICEAPPAITIWFLPGYCLLRRHVAST